MDVYRYKAFFIRYKIVWCYLDIDSCKLKPVTIDFETTITKFRVSNNSTEKKKCDIQKQSPPKNKRQEKKKKKQTKNMTNRI